MLAQVWRGGSGRQALLARAVAGLVVAGVDAVLGRRAGELLARSGTDDAIDAAVVALAADGDWIATSDPGDILTLVAATDRDVAVLPV